MRFSASIAILSHNLIGTLIYPLKNIAMKYLILCANCCHPSGELKYFLLTDEDDNTAEFETEWAAKQWCADAGSEGPLAYTILCTADFHYE